MCDAQTEKIPMFKCFIFPPFLMQFISCGQAEGKQGSCQTAEGLLTEDKQITGEFGLLQVQVFILPFVQLQVHRGIGILVHWFTQSMIF